MVISDRHLYGSPGTVRGGGEGASITGGGLILQMLWDGSESDELEETL